MKQILRSLVAPLKRGRRIYIYIYIYIYTDDSISNLVVFKGCKGDRRIVFMMLTFHMHCVCYLFSSRSSLLLRAEDLLFLTHIPSVLRASGNGASGPGTSF